MSRDAPRESAPAPVTPKANELTTETKAQIGKLLEDLLGTHGAYVLDSNLKILGKVPGSELPGTIKALKTGMHAVVYDGAIDADLVSTCEQNGINFLAGMSASAKGNRTKVLTAEELL